MTVALKKPMPPVAVADPDAPQVPQASKWREAIQQQVDVSLDALLPHQEEQRYCLHEAMRYIVLSGGKRMRPLLVYAAGELTQAQPEALSAAAVSVELIHAYSLVHDDLPCMDNDDLRRGQPTCHKKYDEASALLVGDALQTLAFEHIATCDALSCEQRLEMIQLLAQASGYAGMVGGQAMDLAFVGKKLDQATLELMHKKKTGALIGAAILLGVLSGRTMPPLERTALETFAEKAGLLFQVVDDILDCVGSTDALGKTAGQDMRENKPTFVSILGLEAAQDYAAKLHDEAVSCLQVFGTKGARLIELTRYICSRAC